MLNYKNVVITSTKTQYAYYDEKKKKSIDYKKPKITTNKLADKIVINYFERKK